MRALVSDVLDCRAGWRSAGPLAASQRLRPSRPPDQRRRDRAHQLSGGGFHPVAGRGRDRPPKPWAGVVVPPDGARPEPFGASPPAVAVQSGRGAIFAFGCNGLAGAVAKDRGHRGSLRGLRCADARRAGPVRGGIAATVDLPHRDPRGATAPLADSRFPARAGSSGESYAVSGAADCHWFSGGVSAKFAGRPPPGRRRINGLQAGNAVSARRSPGRARIHLRASPVGVTVCGPKGPQGEGYACMKTAGEVPAALTPLPGGSSEVRRREGFKQTPFWVRPAAKEPGLPMSGWLATLDRFQVAGHVLR